MVLGELLAFPVTTRSILIPSSMVTSRLCYSLVEILIKGAQTSCSCGNPEVDYLLFVFCEKLSLWVGWVYWVVVFIEGDGFGFFCLFVRDGGFVCFGGCVSYVYVLCFAKSLLPNKEHIRNLPFLSLNIYKISLFGYLSLLHTNCFVLE